MGTAVDIFTLDDDEISLLVAATNIDVISANMISLWQFTSFELSELARWWGVDVHTPNQPLCQDESTGFVALEWSPEFILKAASLEVDSFKITVDQLAATEGLQDIDRDIIEQSTSSMVNACKHAQSGNLKVVEVASV